MHKIFSIAEILTPVLVHLGDRNELRGCATLCKSWLRGVTELLWKDGEFVTLLRVAFGPRGLLSISHFQNDSGRVPIVDISQQVPLESDWDRFYYYSSNIQTLWITREDVLTSECMSVLAEGMGSDGRQLFPRVRAFRLWPHSEEHLQISRPLLLHMPELAAITIGSVLLKYTPDMDEFWTDLCQNIQHCTNLADFVVGTKNLVVPSDVIQALSSLPNLRRIRGYFVPVTGNMMGIDTAFTELEEVYWRGTLLPQIFRGAWFPPNRLQSMTSFETTASFLHEVLGPLQSSSIRCLELQLEDDLESSHLRAMANISCLEILEIIVMGELQITDAAIGSLAAGLSYLQRLVILDDHLADLPPIRLGLTSIAHLLKNCKDIAEIDMLFDATLIPSNALPDHAPAVIWDSAASDWTTLIVRPRQSPLGDAEKVASWLRAWCRVGKKKVVIHRLYEDPLWEEVSSRLAGLTL